MKTLLLIYLIVEAVFGIGFLLFPSFLMDPMGVTLDETSTSFARMFGSMIISMPVLLLFALRSTNSTFRKGVAYSACVYLLASTVIIVLSITKGLLNPLGWSMVALHLLFFFWFGYFAVTIRDKN